MGTDLTKLRERVLKKLHTLMTGMPRGLDSESKLKVKKIQFDAAKTLLAYFQKVELSDDSDDDEFDLPTTSTGLRKCLADLGKKLSASDDDESNAA